MKFIKLGFVFIFLNQLIGCSTQPLLSTSENDVAAVLQPISKSNITDARAEFRHIFCSVNKDHGTKLPDYRECKDALHKLSDEPVAKSFASLNFKFKKNLRVLFIPGIFGECMIDEVSPFSYAIDHVNQYPEVKMSIFPGIRGRASSKHNSGVIHQYLTDYKKENGEKLILVAYSKGTTDMLYYLSKSDHADSYKKIDALVSIAGVVNGSPLADDTGVFLKMLANIFPYGKCKTQDESGIDDITREKQFFRLSQQILPDHIKYFSLPAYTERENTSEILASYYDRLALIDPRNDGQVIYYDSVIPGASLLGYANADHWAVVLPFSRHMDSLGFINKMIASYADKNAYPREVLLESIIRFVDTKL